MARITLMESTKERTRSKPHKFLIPWNVLGGFRLCGLCLGALLMSGILVGCAPGLGSTFNVATVETVPAQARGALTGVRVRFDAFTDERSNKVVAVIDGRSVEADRDPAAAAQRIVEAQFRESGVRRGLYEGATIRGTLLEWNIRIVPGFPSTKMRAEAKVRLEVLPIGADALTAKPVYSARYSGVVEEEHPIGSTERIERTFARAMAEAASEALQDEKFLREIQGRSAGQ